MLWLEDCKANLCDCLLKDYASWYHRSGYAKKYYSSYLSVCLPVLKMQDYGLEEIFSRNLLFFLPFFIFYHEKSFSECENDEAKLRKLVDEYHHIATKLDALQESGELSAFTKKSICSMILHVLALIAKEYPKIRKEVGGTMLGKIVDYEAKRILNEGIEKGREEERKILFTEREENAKAMLLDKMEPSRVEKYTHLPLTRIKELAKGLGML